MAAGTAAGRVGGIGINETVRFAPDGGSGRVERSLQARGAVGIQVSRTVREGTTGVVGHRHRKVEAFGRAT